MHTQHICLTACDRQDQIDRQINEAVAARERLEQAESEYRELLEQTKADASRIREEARTEGRAIRCAS